MKTYQRNMQHGASWAFLLLYAVFLLGLQSTKGVRRPLSRTYPVLSPAPHQSKFQARWPSPNSGASSGGAIVLEKLQRPDAELPHMLHLGEEFDRAVRAPGCVPSQRSQLSLIRSYPLTGIA